MKTPGQVNDAQQHALVALTDTFVGELSMHHVPRGLFELIPGEAVETNSERLGRYLTKSVMLVSGAGRSKQVVPLTVFCDDEEIGRTRHLLSDV